MGLYQKLWLTGDLIVSTKQIAGIGGVHNYIPLQCAADNSTNQNKCVSRLTKSADLQGANTNTIQTSSSIRVVNCFGHAPVKQLNS